MILSEGIAQILGHCPNLEELIVGEVADTLDDQNLRYLPATIEHFQFREPTSVGPDTIITIIQALPKLRVLTLPKPDLKQRSPGSSVTYEGVKAECFGRGISLKFDSAWMTRSVRTISRSL